NAVLLDQGNLVLLRNGSNPTQNPTPLWQSFDNPGDTWLPGGKIGLSKESMLYAAARSKDCEVFRVLLRSAASPPGKVVKEMNESEEGFEKEIVNRAVHAAARGGNLEILKELP
ncbi:G-type lectin S-receptor-like serine/threonine-protein kinase At4g11900, partial [Linum perenne]